MDVVLVVAGGAGDLKIVAFAAVPFSIDAVEGKGDLGIDVGVSTGHAKTRTLGGTRDLAANTTLTTLEAFQLRLMLVHT